MSEDAFNPRRLRRRIRIERKVAVPDGSGGESYTFTLRAEVAAEVKPLSGRETLEAAEFVAGASIEFRIRHRDDVEETDRVVWKGAPYDIVHIAEIGRNRGLRLVAKHPGGAATTEA